MRTREGGFALILVIWSLVLLAGMSTGFAFAVRHETRAAADLASVARTEAANAAALSYAIAAMSADDEELRWSADGAVHDLAWQDAKIKVRVQSESGRIDLNRAPRDLLSGLFGQLISDIDPEELADAVMDWRDRDDKRRDKGAESDDYIEAGYAYEPTNRPFNSTNELSQVLGFDREKMELLLPHLTIHSRLPRIHAYSANLVELASIPGVTRADAEAFIAYRESALAAGEKLEFSLLNNGRRYLDIRTNQRLVSLDILVTLADGTKRRERKVVQLDPSRGAKVLARTALPVADFESDPKS